MVDAGNKSRALKGLASLRKRAVSANQWLSIAKRERALKDYAAASRTLAAAEKALPASEVIAACAADTLIELGDLESAARYVDSLRESGFPELASYIDITRTLAAGSAFPSPISLSEAYSATGNDAFRNGAAVMLAATGKFADAQALFPRVEDTEALGNGALNDPGAPLPKDLPLRALLAYDSRSWGTVILLIPAPGDQRVDRELLSTLADAAWNDGKVDLARECWRELVSRYPDASPVPYYNLAVTASDPESARTTLLRCAELFPAWYPAIARIARAGLQDDNRATVNAQGRSIDPADPVIRTLEDAGFISLDMEAAARDGGFSRNEALAVLERAMKTGGKGIDVRIRLEWLRYSLFETGDTVRASATMWNLLEEYRDNPELYRYATWFFAATGDFGSAFSVNHSNPGGATPFFLGLEAVAAGNDATAIEEFSKVASSDRDAWAALGNISRLAARSRDYPRAEEAARLAADLAPDNQRKSRLQGEAGEYLVALNDRDRARKVLGYAIELDPSNYKARARLNALDAAEE